MKIQYVKIIFCIGITTCLINGHVCKALSGVKLKQQLLQERNSPAVRAFLDTIAVAEVGRENAFSPIAYRMMYPSGKTFKGFDHHPGIVTCAQSYGRELCSTAAGRYMFLINVWNTIAQRLDLHDFSPLNQDIAAIYLLHEKKAIESIKKGDVRDALERTKNIWASLPGSPHKQPVRKYEKLKQVFTVRYAHYKKYLRERG